MKQRRVVLAPTSIFIVPHGGYPFDVMVCIGAGENEIANALKARGIDDSEIRAVGCMEPRGMGRCIMLEGGQTVLVLKNFMGTPDDHAHLSHEVFHAVEFLMSRIGIQLVRESDEAFAYAIGLLTRRILEELAKPPSKRQNTP